MEPETAIPEPAAAPVPEPPRKTVAAWARAKGTPLHIAAAVRAYLGADELLEISEGEFDAAVQAFTSATLSVPAAR